MLLTGLEPVRDTCSNLPNTASTPRGITLSWSALSLAATQLASTNSATGAWSFKALGGTLTHTRELGFLLTFFRWMGFKVPGQRLSIRRLLDLLFDSQAKRQGFLPLAKKLCLQSSPISTMGACFCTATRVKRRRPRRRTAAPFKRVKKGCLRRRYQCRQSSAAFRPALGSGRGCRHHPSVPRHVSRRS